jgi:hypothetical protein
VVGRPWDTGCHTVTRKSGRCDDGPYNYVWVGALGRCRWTTTGLCPGGADVVYVV